MPARFGAYRHRGNSTRFERRQTSTKMKCGRIFATNERRSYVTDTRRNTNENRIHTKSDDKSTKIVRRLKTTKINEHPTSAKNLPHKNDHRTPTTTDEQSSKFLTSTNIHEHQQNPLNSACSTRGFYFVLTIRGCVMACRRGAAAVPPVAAPVPPVAAPSPPPVPPVAAPSPSRLSG